jgi:hypothetical protein
LARAARDENDYKQTGWDCQNELPHVLLTDTTPRKFRGLQRD